jgi:hypothetical protein
VPGWCQRLLVGVQHYETLQTVVKDATAKKGKAGAKGGAKDGQAKAKENAGSQKGKGKGKGKEKDLDEGAEEGEAKPKKAARGRGRPASGAAPLAKRHKLVEVRTRIGVSKQACCVPANLPASRAPSSSSTACWV